MTLTWPWALLALVAGPVLLATAVVARRRRRKRPCGCRTWPRSAPLSRLAPTGSGASPSALLVASLVVLGVGAARPTADGDRLPQLDVDPAGDGRVPVDVLDRRPAEPPHRRPGGGAHVHPQPGRRDADRAGRLRRVRRACRPADDRPDELLDAIDKLTTSRGTAIGMAILASIDAIAEHNPDVAPTGVELGAGGDQPAPTAGRRRLAGDADRRRRATSSRTRSSCSPTAPTPGVEPLVAAQEAAARHVRVYTIGFGTTDAVAAGVQHRPARR